jgi:hypothetical protein
VGAVAVKARGRARPGPLFSAPQRALPLRPKVRAASLCPRALSTTKHASNKLSHAPLRCDSSRSYDYGVNERQWNGRLWVQALHWADARLLLSHGAALGKRPGLCGAEER